MDSQQDLGQGPSSQRSSGEFQSHEQMPQNDFFSHSAWNHHSHHLNSYSNTEQNRAPIYNMFASDDEMQEGWDQNQIQRETPFGDRQLGNGMQYGNSFDLFGQSSLLQFSQNGTNSTMENYGQNCFGIFSTSSHEVCSDENAFSNFFENQNDADRDDQYSDYNTYERANSFEKVDEQNAQTAHNEKSHSQESIKDSKANDTKSDFLIQHHTTNASSDYYRNMFQSRFEPQSVIQEVSENSETDFQSQNSSPVLKITQQLMSQKEQILFPQKMPISVVHRNSSQTDANPKNFLQKKSQELQQKRKSETDTRQQSNNDHSGDDSQARASKEFGVNEENNNHKVLPFFSLNRIKRQLNFKQSKESSNSKGSNRDGPRQDSINISQSHVQEVNENTKFNSAYSKLLFRSLSETQTVENQNNSLKKQNSQSHEKAQYKQKSTFGQKFKGSKKLQIQKLQKVPFAKDPTPLEESDLEKSSISENHGNFKDSEQQPNGNRKKLLFFRNRTHQKTSTQQALNAQLLKLQSSKDTELDENQRKPSNISKEEESIKQQLKPKNQFTLKKSTVCSGNFGSSAEPSVQNYDVISSISNRDFDKAQTEKSVRKEPENKQSEQPVQTGPLAQNHHSGVARTSKVATRIPRKSFSLQTSRVLAEKKQESLCTLPNQKAQQKSSLQTQLKKSFQLTKNNSLVAPKLASKQRSAVLSSNICIMNGSIEQERHESAENHESKSKNNIFRPRQNTRTRESGKLFQNQRSSASRLQATEAKLSKARKQSKNSDMDQTVSKNSKNFKTAYQQQQHKPSQLHGSVNPVYLDQIQWLMEHSLGLRKKIESNKEFYNSIFCRIEEIEKRFDERFNLDNGRSSKESLDETSV